VPGGQVYVSDGGVRTGTTEVAHPPVTVSDGGHAKELLPLEVSQCFPVHRKDIEHPIGTFLYTISCMHCMTVSLAQGGEGLGAMWGEEKTREYLQKAGFRAVTTHRLAHDLQNNWYVVTK
jgi:hypothetical protein